MNLGQDLKHIILKLFLNFKLFLNYSEFGTGFHTHNFQTLNYFEFGTGSHTHYFQIIQNFGQVLIHIILTFQTIF